MPDKQLEIILALFAGVQTAIAHLSTVVGCQARISPDDLARSFEATAEATPPDTNNRELILLVLNQIAFGIRNGAAVRSVLSRDNHVTALPLQFECRLAPQSGQS